MSQLDATTEEGGKSQSAVDYTLSTPFPLPISLLCMVPAQSVYVMHYLGWCGSEEDGMGMIGRRRTSDVSRGKEDICKWYVQYAQWVKCEQPIQLYHKNICYKRTPELQIVIA